MAVYERDGELVLKKSPSWCLRGRQQQGYKQTRVSDAAGNRHSRRLAAYDGATRPFGVSCSTTSASKIRFLKTTCYVSSTATSVSILCVRSCVHPTAKRGDRRLIRKCCCGSCCWDISTASPVSGSCWKNCACTWRGAGSRGWGSSRRFPITRHSRRTGTDGSKNRSCSNSCLKKSWHAV